MLDLCAFNYFLWYN